MSHRSFRSTGVPGASGLAAAIAVSWLIGAVGAVPALATAGYGGTAQSREWWLAGLHVTQAWQTTEEPASPWPYSARASPPGTPTWAARCRRGRTTPARAGRRADPSGASTGPRCAGVIAGHGHGTGRESGLLGIAPAAKILSIRVNLEYNDPLNSDPAVARRLPAAIAAGITYAADHGARVIDLPLDPGTAGLTGLGEPGRGRRQPGRAGGGDVRAAQERGPGGPGRR